MWSGCGSTATVGMVDLAPPPMGYATTTGVKPALATVAPPPSTAPATMAGSDGPR
jgi:hypothetical protein